MVERKSCLLPPAWRDTQIPRKTPRLGHPLIYPSRGI
jgi:hypothetical protein